MLKRLSLPSVASSEFGEVFSALEASGLIRVEAPKRGKGRVMNSLPGHASFGSLSGHSSESMLAVKVTYEEVSQALAEEHIFKSIFDQIN